VQDSSWEDDVDTFGPLGGGVYYDRDTGKYYADINYSYIKKSGLFKDSKLGKGKHRVGDDLIELTADELDAFQNWRESNEGQRYRGRRGKGQYTGPGRAVSSYVPDDVKDQLTTGALSPFRNLGEQNEDNVRQRLQNERAWWNIERASGARGMRRKQIVGARREAIKSMQARAARQGWGKTERRTERPT
jgi:hypothetical protein